VIAIIYPQFYGVGGIARYLESFLQNLPANAPAVTLVTGDEGRRAGSFRGVEIVHVPFTSSRFNLLTWGWRVRELLLRWHASGRIECVNLHWPPLIPGLLLPARIPLVLTAHTTYRGMSGEFYGAHYFDSQWSKGSLRIKKAMEQRILSGAAKVITLTEQGRQEIRSYAYHGPVAVIPNGADVVKFTPDRSVGKDIDVLFSGRIEQRKGSRAIPALCRRIVAARPGVRICIVGYGEDESWVSAQLQGLGASVHMTGKVPFEQMIGYYNRSSVYVSTSCYEGLPGTCLEAMAMGLPAVVWDFLFYRGLVTSGETGLLAAPNDFAAMTDNVLALLDDAVRARRLGEAGRQVLLDKYSWQRLAAEIIAELAL
jgi:glycosyltransferase involved in cell wall biosynthesis